MSAPSANTPRPDFLGQLVERSAEIGNSIEPRLPSLFEPVPWTAQRNLFDSDEETTAAPTEEPALRTPLHRPFNHAPESNPRVAQRDSEGTRNDVEPRETMRASRMAAPEHRPGAVASATNTEIIREIVADRISREASPVLPLKTAHIDGRELPRHEPSVRKESASPVAREPQIVEPSPRTENPTTPLRASSPERVVAEPSALLTASRILREPPSTRAADPAPVINVTIGRLEIRATQEAKPVKRAPATGVQPMSLEDYMKQRGRGR